MSSPTSSTRLRSITRSLALACAALTMTCAPQLASAATQSVTWTSQDDFERNVATTGVTTTRKYLDTATWPGDVKIGMPRDIVTTATLTQIAVGGKIYSTGVDRASLAVLDAASNSLLKTIPLPAKPSGVVHNSANNKLYVGSEDKVYVVDCTSDNISATLSLGTTCYAALYNPTSNKVYLAKPADQTVVVLDGATDSVIATIPVTAGAYTAYHNAALNRVYFTSKLNQYLVAIDGATDLVLKSIEIDPSFSLLGGQAPGSVGLQSLSSSPADQMKLSWNADPLSPGQKVLFQVRTAQDAAALDVALFRGPDGTADTWFEATSAGATTLSESDGTVTNSIILPFPYAPAAEIQVKLASDGISTPALHAVTLDYLTYPDLTVSAVSGPGIGVIGATIDLASSVVNQGGEPAGAFKVGLNLYNPSTGAAIALGERNVAGLAAGSTDSASTTVGISNVAPGTYTLQVCADTTNAVTEGYENNNCTMGSSISIVTPPELVVTSTVGPNMVYCSEDEVPICNTYYTNPEVGYGYTVSATIANQGGYLAGGSKVAVYLANGTTQYKIGEQNVAALAVGGSTSVGVPVTIPFIPVGSYTFKTCADSAGQVAEGDENNNCTMGNTVNVIGKDLVATSAIINPLGPPTSLAIGSFTTAHISVQNIGGATVPSGSQEAILFHNNATGVDYFFASKSTRALSPGQSDVSLGNYVSGTISTLIPPGNYTLKACADYSNLVAETNENNNCFLGMTLNLY